MTLPRRFRSIEAPGNRPFISEVAATESLFGRWSRYCWRSPMSASEVQALFEPHSAASAVLAPRRAPPIAPCVNAPSTGWAAASHEFVAQLLNLSRAALAMANGAALGAPETWSSAMSNTLRVCWPCMRLGFHSTLFQHLALRRCPLHGLEMSTRCSACRTELRAPSFKSIACSPFACHQCGALWILEVEPRTKAEDLLLAGLMLADRARDLGLAEPHCRRKAFVRRSDAVHRSSHAERTPSAKNARYVARSSVWPEYSSPKWPTFNEQRMLLADWRGNARWPMAGKLSARAGTASLRFLGDCCAVHQQDSEMLRSRLSLVPRGLRLNSRVSLVSAALHQTMCAYGRCANEAAERSGWCGVYDDIAWNGMQSGLGLPESDSGNAELVEAEILGFFVACLLRDSKLVVLPNVDWCVELPAASYLPAWVVEASDERYTLRFRPRAGSALVRRLVRRYQSTDILSCAIG